MYKTYQEHILNYLHMYMCLVKRTKTTKQTILGVVTFGFYCRLPGMNQRNQPRDSYCKASISQGPFRTQADPWQLIYGADQSHRVEDLGRLHHRQQILFLKELRKLHIDADTIGVFLCLRLMHCFEIPTVPTAPQKQY